MPPTAVPVRVRNLVTGTVAASRSSTLQPAAVMPTIAARFNIRAARLESRDVATVAPLGSVVAYARATRSATSGERSTFAMPATPYRPKRLLEPRDSQMIEEFTTAPASMILCG